MTKRTPDEILDAYERDLAGPLARVGTKTILLHATGELRRVVDAETRRRLEGLRHDRRALHEPDKAKALANLRAIVTGQ